MRRALLAGCAVILCLPAAAEGAGSVAGAAGSVAGAGSYPPTTDYQPRPVCAAPAPGHAGCLALELVPGASTAPLRARSPLARPLQTPPVPSARAQAGQGGTGQVGGPVGTSYAAGQTPEPVYPKELRSAYNLPEEPVQGSAPQTIALVDAYNDPSAEGDLSVYDKTLNLAPCTAANGCFAKVNQHGEPANEGASGTPFPKSAKELEVRKATCAETKQKTVCAEVEEATGWAVEISTDLDVAHSLCPSCRILLVEANSSSFTDLEAAENTAASLGATEISNSWGGAEPEGDSAAFHHPGTVITAAAGDNGYLNWTAAAGGAGNGYFAGAGYPASSPHVVAVGGTELTLTKAGVRKSETVWNEDPDPSGGNQGAGGGGCSAQFPAPEWQLEMTDWASVGCGFDAEAKRAVADVAADADPYSGVLVYDSQASTKGLLVIGGTSVASPIVASVFALAGGSHGVEDPAQTLYFRHGRGGSPSLYDVTEGGNGKCDNLYASGCRGSLLSSFDCGAGALICNAARGYDGPTGVGAPNGIAAFEPESKAEHTQKVEAEAAAEKQSEERRKAEEAEHQREAEVKAAEARKAEEERRAAEKLSEEAHRSSVGGSGGAVAAGAGRLGGGLGETQLSGGSPAGGTAGASGSAKGVSLTALALTARARAALARGLPTLSQVAFAFVLSAPARVQVTLTREVFPRGRPRWTPVPGAFTFAAARGRDHGRLRGHGALAPGRYRLTLTPAHGAARSIVFVA